MCVCVLSAGRRTPLWGADTLRHTRSSGGFGFKAFQPVLKGCSYIHISGEHFGNFIVQYSALTSKYHNRTRWCCDDTIAEHRHQNRCRRHRHSGILYLSPVPEHSGTGLGTLILIPNCFRPFCSFPLRTDWMPDSPTFPHLKRGTHSTSILLAVERAHTHTPCMFILLAVEEDRPCMSILLAAVERHTHCTLYAHTPDCGNGYTLHVHSVGCGKGHTLHFWEGIHPACHTAGCGNGTVCMSVLLAVERDTRCTFILLAAEINTSCTSLPLAMERDTNTGTYCCWWNGIHPAHLYCWLRK